MSNDPSSRQDRAVHLTLAFTVCLSAFAIDVSLPAIPEAIKFYGSADQAGQQIVALYLAGYALGQIPFGLAADRYGRMRVFYVGILLFMVATAATVLAPSMESLLVARFVQGVAGASGPIVSRAIARDIAEGKALASLTALLVTSLAVSTLVAPLVGSVVSFFWGWRATFLVSLVMGAVALVLMRCFLRETVVGEQGQATVWHQFCASARVFGQSRASIWGTALVSLTFFAYMAIVAGLAQVVVDVFGMPASAVGVVLGSAIFFQVGSAQIGRRALHRYASVQLLRCGFWFYGLSALICLVILYFQVAHFWLFWLSLVTFLIGMGLVFPNATAITLTPLRRAAGFGASILGTIQIIFATMGASLTGLLYDRTVVSMMLVLTIGTTLAALAFVIGLRSRRMTLQ